MLNIEIWEESKNNKMCLKLLQIDIDGDFQSCGGSLSFEM